MGYSYAAAQLLSSPPYVFATIMSLATAWISDKMKIRWPIICAQCVVAVVGLVIVRYGGAPGFRYFGLFLAVYGSQANGPQFLAYAQNQTATINKKGIVAAVMISVGAAGGVTGSTIFRSQDAPVRWNIPSLLAYHVVCRQSVLTVTGSSIGVYTRYMDNNSTPNGCRGRHIPCFKVA